ncbi:MAG TPA: efflux RND transporter permease subunit [Thermotogota bacterium]|nr:efflux RND transporter permease subunit [Thermotogota bacterium]
MWQTFLRMVSKKPVTIFLLFSTLIVLGYFAYTRMPMDLLPELELPYVAVFAPYIGAEPTEVEQSVTRPLEKVLGVVSGVKSIASDSMEGFSMIQIELDSETDLNAAVQRIRDALSQKMFLNLPENVEPMVFEMSTSMIPIYILSLSSDDRSLLKEGSDDLQKALSRVDGVASIQVVGLDETMVQVQVKPNLLESLDVPLEILKTNLGSGMRFPMGTVQSQGKTFPLTVSSRFDSIEALKNTVIGFRGMGAMMSSESSAAVGGAASAMTGGFSFQLPALPIPVPLKMVADVQQVVANPDNYATVNGKSAAVLIVQKMSNANTVQVVKKLQQQIEQWQALNPKLETSEVMNTSAFTEEAVQGLFQNLLIGALAAVFVIFFFLRNFSATIAIGLSIPLSLLIALVFSYFSGLGLDLMTVGGLTMAVGMIVDNSIVVLESIFRYREKKASFEDSAALGGSEVVEAIFASTLTTLAMFVPLAFTTGMASQIFKYFALTLALSLGASLFVAIVMVPAFSRVLKPRKPSFVKTTQWYSRHLQGWLKKKKTLFAFFGGLFAVSILLVVWMGIEFIPTMDSGQVVVSMQLPSNLPFSQFRSLSEEMDQLLLQQAEELEVEVFFTRAGSGGGSNMMALFTGSAGGSVETQLQLKPKAQRSLSTDEVQERLLQALQPLAQKYQAEVNVSAQGADFSQMFGSPIQVVFFDEDLESLEKKASALAQGLRDIGGLTDIRTSFEETEEFYELSIDRSKALMSGTLYLQAFGALQPYLSGVELGTIFMDGKEVPVKLFLEHAEVDPISLMQIPVSTLSGDEKSLGSFSTLAKKRSPSVIKHLRSQRVAYVYATPGGDNPLGLGKAGEQVEELLQQLFPNLPLQEKPVLEGQVNAMRSTFSQFLIAFAAGILLMYLIMGAQFESFVFPLIIFLTLPMALVGIVLTNLPGFSPINISNMIGILTLAGVLVNNGIVMISHINHLREKGMERVKAIVTGAGERLRPILMTTLTTVIALVPTMFAAGEASEIQRPMAATIAVGLFVGTMFTLVLIPLLYDTLDRFSKRFREGK